MPSLLSIVPLVPDAAVHSRMMGGGIFMGEGGDDYIAGGVKRIGHACAISDLCSGNT